MADRFFRDSLPNQESLHGLQQVLPPELAPRGWGESLGFVAKNAGDLRPGGGNPTGYELTDDMEGAVDAGAEASIFSSPEIISRLKAIFGSSMFNPDEGSAVKQAELEAKRKAEQELMYRLALEEQARNGGVNRESNAFATAGAFNR